ncbi:NADH-quinone oxidoreductase subunit C [Nitrospira tepida]|uniref:NADH-quinone oxidoreductase subunit C n=1 Tax=Nitrospira tepida TaxID=2973512 RepID=A0AA86MVW3_9BACT|nr:NADH-quinone oxidoreductase subunit C [Nitrospira tepida]CAI4029984.1 NADH-quinone oxidoreductase subunit C [Nitrospira tepida]
MTADSLHPMARRIKDAFPEGFVKAVEWRGDLAVTVTPDALHRVARLLHDDPALDFDYIVHVSSVDWPEDEERFEVVYEFYSIRKRHRIRLKTRVRESDCVVDSLCDIWKGADFMEREVFDMMGIRFRNHPDLRRILMPDEYTEGYPLRKDFPLRGKGWRDTFDFLNEPMS